MKTTSLIMAAAVCAGLLTATASDAGAIPAFARKYGVSCMLCHQPVPRLTPFGEEFAGNGFQFAPGEAMIDGVETGDPELRLMRSFPLAMRVDAYVRNLRSADAPNTDLQTPWGIKLLSGGPIAENVSYYAYFYMSEHGEIAGLEDAYVQFTDLLGSGVNLMVGQFQVSDPLFKRELRLEYEDYQAYRVRVGETRADLTYDRGLMALYSPWDGGDLTVQLVNGRGLGEATDKKLYDEDDWKSWAFRFSQSVDRFRIGGFAYFGLERANGLNNEIRIFGPDATIALSPKVELNLQYLRRTDKRPFYQDFSEPSTDVDMGLAELIVAPQGATGKWFFTALYNHVEADDAIFSIRQGEDGLLQQYRSAALGANYLLARNLRMTGETMYDLNSEDLRLVFGFMAAF